MPARWYFIAHAAGWGEAGLSNPDISTWPFRTAISIAGELAKQHLRAGMQQAASIREQHLRGCVMRV